MSTRALRKALRARELVAQEQEGEQHELQDGGDSDDGDTVPQQKQSLFALLGEAEEEPEVEEEEEDAREQEEEEEVVIRETVPSVSKKNRKKRKKKKLKPAPGVEGEDEIDAALRQLNLKRTTISTVTAEIDEDQSLFSVLAIDPRNFDAAVEMRHLFGRAAVSEDPAPEVGVGAGRGRGRGRGRGAVAGKTRRNLFVQARDIWPPGGSGLGMEIVAESADGTVEFRFVHSTAYQDVQRQFMMCVGSMDPNRLLQLLQNNPYHIATLLTCSDLFTHQRDHATSRDLLERALFTFGRVVHSSFSSCLAAGTARLSYTRPENREFFTCAARYTTNLQMRGTWRTAAEYTLLQLSLSPDDPTAARLNLDTVLLRSRQPERLLKLLEHPLLRRRWADVAGLAYSLPLAYALIEQDGAAREYLARAVARFPWVAERLWRETGSDDVPKLLWGVLPPPGAQEVLGEVYALRAKDMWKEEGARDMLRVVASGVRTLRPVVGGKVDMDVARGVLAMEVPAVTALLPRAFLSGGMAWDVLPPLEQVRSYEVVVQDVVPGAGGDVGGFGGQGAGSLVAEFLRSLFPHLDRGVEPTTEMVREALRERGIDLDVADLGMADGGEEEDEEREGGLA